MNDFEEECTEWLKPFGYDVQAINGSRTMVMLANYKNLGEGYPCITCRVSDGQRTAELSGGDLKMWFTISSQEIAFGYKDIEKYILTMKHYINLCEDNHPW